MRKAVVTGGAGFIGSHIADKLVARDYHVIILDDLSSGKLENINGLLNGDKAEFIRGSVTDLPLLQKLFHDAEFVFHQAALTQIPSSIEDPLPTNEVNIGGTLKVLIAAEANKVKKVVYASSSAIYGDAPSIPQEDNRAARVLLYHPEYYRSLTVKLYNFDGQAFIPTETIVISYEEREEVKLITFAEVFDNYEEAATFISNQESGDFRIVGRHPFNSPVPLAALEQYKSIHSSQTVEIPAFRAIVPEVKIFEYIGN